MERTVRMRGSRHAPVPDLQLALALGNPYLPAAAEPSKMSLAIVTAHREGRLIALWPLVRP